MARAWPSLRTRRANTVSSSLFRSWGVLSAATRPCWCLGVWRSPRPHPSERALELNLRDHWIHRLWLVDILSARGQTHQTATDVGLIHRFFVIILLIVTIVWVPIIQAIDSEQLFEYMHAVRSYLVPPIAAIFLLAIFCKRVTEQVGGCVLARVARGRSLVLQVHSVAARAS